MIFGDSWQNLIYIYILIVGNPQGGFGEGIKYLGRIIGLICLDFVIVGVFFTESTMANHHVSPPFGE